MRMTLCQSMHLVVLHLGVFFHGRLKAARFRRRDEPEGAAAAERQGRSAADARGRRQHERDAGVRAAQRQLALLHRPLRRPGGDHLCSHRRLGLDSGHLLGPTEGRPLLHGETPEFIWTADERHTGSAASEWDSRPSRPTRWPRPPCRTAPCVRRWRLP